MHMKTSDTILEEIKPIVADILAVEPEEVRPESRFFEDLGGESIDMLELAFQLEKRYGTPIPVQKIAASDDLVTDTSGRLTDASLAAMRTKYPFLDYSRLEANPLKDRISELFTIEALARFVVAAMNSKSSCATGRIG
jgi:acyl carrier protein